MALFGHQVGFHTMLPKKKVFEDLKTPGLAPSIKNDTVDFRIHLLPCWRANIMEFQEANLRGAVDDRVRTCRGIADCTRSSMAAKTIARIGPEHTAAHDFECG